jgi:hypothetical protein
MTLGIIAGCISVLAFCPYLISILKGKTKPNRVTWWIWSLLGVLLFYSYRASGATDTLWVPLSYMITPLITALLSIKYGVGGWTKFDLMCLFAAATSTLVWFVSGSPSTAVLLYLCIDLFGILPTIRKTFFYPEQEDKLAWLLMVIANALNIAAAGKFEFSIIVYPLYMLLCGCVILGLSLRTAKRGK